MDQIKIGRFIAQMRKAQDLTQRQLAETLSISDKTISKWECGKGLPEASLMLPLCEALQITVNDLLTGEKVSEIDYQNKAEENMVNLIQENAEHKKQFILSVICAVITIIAALSLVMLAAYVGMPVIGRVGLIAAAVITAVVGIGAAVVLDTNAGYYECPHCKALFVPTIDEYVKSFHTFTKRRLKCHECGRTDMCKHRIIR